MEADMYAATPPEALELVADKDKIPRCDFFFSSRRRHTRSLRDWSSDVCSSDLRARRSCAGRADRGEEPVVPALILGIRGDVDRRRPEIGRASCRERV